MTALGAELAASFARCFALLADLRQLAPAEHSELMRRLCAQLVAATRDEQERRSLAAAIEPAAGAKP